MLDTVRKASYLVGTDRRWRWALVVLLALLVSGFEAMGAVLVFSLLSMVTVPSRNLELPVVGDIRAALPHLSNRQFMTLTAAAIAVFFLTRAGLVLAQAYLQHRVAHQAGSRLSVRLLEGYLRMPYEFSLSRNSAELIRNAYDTVQVFVRELLIPFSRVISEMLIVVGVLAVLISTAPLGTILAVLALAPITAGLLRSIHPRLKRLGALSQDLSTASLSALQQSLEGTRDIKILGRERAFVRQFRRQRDEFARAQYLRGAAREIPRITLETTLIFFVLALFGVTLIMGRTTQETLSVLGLFAYAALRLKPSINNIMSGLNAAKFAAPAIDHLHDDVILVESARQSAPDPDIPPLPFEREIRLEGVRFRYEGTDEDVLRGIDLVIEHGESVGVVGPTGGGKTTLVDVVLGLLQPTEGKVLVDGVDVGGRLPEWHRNLGVVPQMVFLVDDTLRANICLGMDPDEVDEDQLAEAVQMAQLEDFVASLPRGLDTVVGERGVRVSGGQRQRIAIARALYRRPEVLVFDEGTSALDTLTEAELIRAIERLRGERTILTVAHRLVTVRACDRILLIQDGRITDSGSFDELAARNRDFRAMAGQV